MNPKPTWSIHQGPHIFPSSPHKSWGSSLVAECIYKILRLVSNTKKKMEEAKEEEEEEEEEKEKDVLVEDEED